jgi:molybdate transport system substrate-binding protein
MATTFTLISSNLKPGNRQEEIVRSGRLATKTQSRCCFYALLLALTVFLCACHGAWRASSSRVTLTLSVAASLQNVIVDAESAYQRDHAEVEFSNNFGSSGTLSREIEQGAPVDAFLSAAAKPIDNLDAKGLILAGTRRTLLRNSLVLIAPRDSQLKGFEGLTDKSVRLIALGDPASVPAGQYGRQTLTALHLMDKLNAKLVMGKDVRQVLTYVETGNADAGIVYGTDAAASTRVRIVAIAPESSHEPIVYPVAVVRSSRNQEATRKFIEYLSSPDAKAIFTKRGFTIVAS